MPDRILRVISLTYALSIVDKDRTNEAPGEKRSSEHRDSRIETNEHTRTDESGGDFNIPSPVLNVYGPVRVATPYIEPGMSGPKMCIGNKGVLPSEHMPVIEDANRIIRCHTVDKGSSERVSQTLELPHSITATTACSVHRPNGNGRGSS